MARVMSEGVDHVCSLNAKHACWDYKSRSGEQCPCFVHGHQCKGELKAIGAGSRKANEAANV